MSVNASSHWMDRVRTAAQAKPYRSISLRPLEQESRETINARAALRSRAGVTQEDLYLLARDRRTASLRARRPLWVLLALGLIAAGVATSVVGSMLAKQGVLLSGFGVVFAGLLVGCAVLATAISPQTGDLAKYVHAHEAPASAEEVVALARAARANPELDELIRSWWKESGAPIRKQDLALVRAFQQAKLGS